MEIVYAGFGGQGVLTSGLVTAYIAMKHDYEVLWSPAYGGQMRGGKAYSMVKFDKKPIAEPLISKLDVLVAMNKPALDFSCDLRKEGLLIVNSDVVEESSPMPDVSRIIRIPVKTLAEKAGSAQAANLVSIGAVVKATHIFDPEEACQVMCEFFENKGKGKYNDANIRAFNAGCDCVG